MTDKDSARQQVAALVEKFDADYKRYTAPSYNETQVRVEFINRFFESLGWDISDSKGRHEVFHEDYVEVEEAGKKRGKRPDYGFRLNNTTRFYVEAKKPSVNLKDDPTPAFQVRRYGWSARLPVSVLTDFEEFIVYDCRIKPDEEDRPTKGRLRYYTYKEYVEKWDEIYDLFSYEAVQANRLETWIQETKQRGTVTVDDAFLSEMEEWREALAKNIAKNNHGLTRRQLNMAVQTTIDRIVFLRICEDRGIEPPDRLQAFGRGTGVYANLTVLFKQADARYNSGLFHFDDEKGREEPDTITLGLTISDDILQNIIGRLYYPSPYAFAVIPADILGQIYERFLGKVIELTPSGGAKVEEKPEVRKAGGVFYTPTYIVEYIVKNTVGKLVEGKTPDQVAKLRILDPACGSGSFLIGAYQFLLDWHLNYYTADGTAKHLKAKRLREVVSTAPAIDDIPAAVTYALTTDIKKRILLNNIYGVDLDQQAVEVTKLSLLLKVLEGETAVTAQPELFAERVLPDLGNNIKWGNSLIEPDYYLGKMFPDEEEIYRIQAFDWWNKTDGFGKIMDAGGFDAVIGNPPYLRIQGLQEYYGNQIGYLASKYISAVKRFDLYLLFAEKGFLLLKKEGFLGIICPHKFVNSDFGSGLRKFIVDNFALKMLISFGNNLVFKQASTYTGIVIFQKTFNEGFLYYEFGNVANSDLSILLEMLDTNDYANVELKNLSAEPWVLTSSNTKSVLSSLSRYPKTLFDITDQILVGVQSGIDNVHILKAIDTQKNGVVRVFSERANSEIDIESGLIKPFLMGEDVHRYEEPKFSHYIIYPYHLVNNQTKIFEEGYMKEAFPLGYSYLKEYKSELREIRERQKTNTNYWYSCHRSRDMRVFESKRIVTPEISLGCNMTFVSGGIYHNTKCYSIIPSNMNESPNYLLGLLNSSISWYFVSNTGYVLRGGYYVFKTNYLGPFPVRTIDFNNAREQTMHDKVVQLVENMLDLHKQLSAATSPQVAKTIQSVIAKTDRDIDQLVYQLYDLTPEEIALVEGNA